MNFTKLTWTETSNGFTGLKGLSRFEMAQILGVTKGKDSDGRDLVARDNSGNMVYYDDGFIRWKYSKGVLSLQYDANETWEIIPKKLKRMSFGEAMWYYYNANVLGSLITSVVDGSDVQRGLCSLSKEALMGEWVIEGIHED